MPDKPEGTTRPGRWLKPILVLSLALNLLVVGTIAGVAWRHDGPGHKRDGHDGPGGRGFAFVRALPDESRDALRATFRDAHEDREAARAERRMLERKVLEVLQQDPLDPAALNALMARQTALGARVQSRVQEAWLEQVLRMDAEARTAYAARVSELLERKPRRGRD
ncbi:periplasmic heavy metal sensor [Sulfitobacter sp. D35]|uniref:periplasmic heavy metal sensor n=1 Tax=Sulfitobacter sp. D35 TaxID=3083252 RepID=UPI00296EBD92|nr:periplasmic heavy metal sensor [Sulfitobacter sp. D35]MDW4496618.1 periplasmic heavy metal sensor [Sulfitobacter sp. D35]